MLTYEKIKEAARVMDKAGPPDLGYFHLPGIYHGILK